MANTGTYVWDWDEKRRVPASEPLSAGRPQPAGRHALRAAPTPSGQSTFVLAVLLGVALMFVMVVAASGLLALLLVVAAAVAVLWWHCGEQVDEWVARGGKARRAQIESFAVVDVSGGCGWCGSRIAHRDARGAIVTPRAWHAAEIEEWISLGAQR